jgi:hypothetical protein
MQYINDIQEGAIHFMATVAERIDYLRAILRLIYIDHPNAYIHIMTTGIISLLLLVLIQQCLLMRKLDGIDKRDFISLLSIQKYCAAITRSINNLTETVKETDKETKNKLMLVHTRMKDVYAGIFTHLNLNRIRRAPKSVTSEQCEKMQNECEERNAILREVYTEMLATE